MKSIRTTLSLCVVLVLCLTLCASTGPLPLDSGEASDADGTVEDGVSKINVISVVESDDTLAVDGTSPHGEIVPGTSPHGEIVPGGENGRSHPVSTVRPAEEGSGGEKKIQSLEGDMLSSGPLLGKDEVSDFFAEIHPLSAHSKDGLDSVDGAEEKPPLKAASKGNSNFLSNLYRSSEEIDIEEESDNPEGDDGLRTTTRARPENSADYFNEEVDTLQPSKVYSLTGNSYLVYNQDWAQVNYSVAVAFQVRLKDSILLYVVDKTKRNFYSMTVDSEGALVMSSTREAGKSPQESMLIDLHEEVGSGDQETFDDTEVDSESEEDTPFVSSVLHPNVVDGSWHTLTISWAGVLNTESSYIDLDVDLSVTVDGQLHTFAKKGLEMVYPSQIFFGYISDLEEGCNSVETCPTPGSGGKYQYDVGGGTCRAGHRYGFPSEAECVAACRVLGLTSYNPLSGCLRDITFNWGDHLRNLPQAIPDVFSIVPKGRLVTAPLSDTCPQLASPWPAVSLLHPGAHFQLPPPCSPTFSLSLEVRPFALDDSPAPAILMSGHLTLTPAGGHGEFKWKLLVKHQKLHFSVINLNKSISSLSLIEDNNWNYVKLSSDGQQVVVSLDGLHHQLSFDGRTVRFTSFTVGDHQIGITACLNNIVLDGHKLDARKVISHRNGVLAGLCLEKELCSHGGETVVDGDLSCNCTATGYEGPHCQFSQHPRSCPAYRALGYTRSGLYVVDVDGEGAIPPIEVRCDFLETSTNTAFSHNLPENFVIKADEKRSRRLDISYPGGQALRAHIKELASSGRCEQKIEFWCRNFPLKLARNKTLLSYDGESYTNRLGSSRAGVCPCKEKESCSKSDVVCNCDVADDDERSDVVWLKDPQHLPLSSFVFGDGDDDDDSELRLSLGSVSCSEPVPAAKAISLLRPTSKAQLTLAKGASLSFAFKTLQSDAVLLHTAESPTSRPVFSVVLRHGTALDILYDNMEVSHNLAGYPLNSDVWQHVLLDGSDGHMRLTLNGHKTYADIHNSWSTFSRTETVVTFGGGGLSPTPDGIPGFIGCIKDVRANFVPVDFDEQDLTSHGCTDLCVTMDDLYGDRCKLVNMAEDYEQRCAGRLRGSGEALDPRDGIRFTDSKAEVLYDLQGEEEMLYTQHNPLSSDVRFTFRTREPSALLLFTYDNSQNVLQVHLDLPTAITVIFNNEFELLNISIGTGVKRMDTGSPILFFLERKKHGISAGVSIDGCWFNSSLEVTMKYISPDHYLQYPFEDPHPLLTKIQQAKTVPLGFLSVHLGGANTGGANSPVPNLIGCITDFRINDDPSATTELKKGLRTTGGVGMGCVDINAACGPTDCQNGGLCLPTFSERSVHPLCDCSGTSHEGVDCTEETCFGLGETHTSNVAVNESYSHNKGPDFELDFVVAIESGKGIVQPKHRSIIFFTVADETCGVKVDMSVTNSSSLVLRVTNSDHTEWVLTPWMLRADLLQGHHHHVVLSYRHPNLNFYFDGRHIHLSAEKQSTVSCISNQTTRPPTHRLSINAVGMGASSLYLSNFRLKLYWETFDLPSIFPYLRGQHDCPAAAVPMYTGAARLPPTAAGTPMQMSAPQMVPYGSEAEADTDDEEETDTDDSSMTLIIILSVVCVLVLLIVITLLILCIRKVKKQHNESVNPHVHISRSYSRSRDSRASAQSNIYVNAESIPLRRGEMASYVAASAPPDPEPGEAAGLLQQWPSDIPRVSDDFVQQPLILSSLSDEVQGQLGNGHATGQGYIANDGTTEDNGLNENSHLVNYRGLSMANDMLYESAQRQKQFQNEHQEEYDERENIVSGEVKSMSAEDGELESGDLVLKNSDQGVGYPSLNDKDSHVYEDYDFKEDVKNSEKATEKRNSENAQPPKATPHPLKNIQPNETELRNSSSSDDEKLKETSAKDNVQKSYLNEDEQRHSIALDDDSTAYAVPSKGQFVRYSGQPTEPSLASNPVYEAAPQIKLGQQQQPTDPGRQEENYSQNALLETSFMEEEPKPVENKVSFSDNDQITPEVKDGKGVPEDDSKDDDDWLVDDGTSVDDDQGWFSKRHLVISLSNADGLPIQEAKIVSKQTSSQL